MYRSLPGSHVADGMHRLMTFTLTKNPTFPTGVKLLMSCYLEHHITSLPADRIRESEGSQMLQLIEECFKMDMMPVAIRQPEP